jgi:hypothetical protein
VNNRDLDRAVAERLGYTYDGSAWWTHPDGLRTSVDGLPRFSADIAAAWIIVEHLRDQWTEATAHVPGSATSFPTPFDDGAFFDVLHRHADRRWPWAFLYVTPEAICRAFLTATEPYDTATNVD